MGDESDCWETVEYNGETLEIRRLSPEERKLILMGKLEEIERPIVRDASEGDDDE